MAFTTVVTVYGSYLKIFSSDPKVGYFANHNVYADAIAAGRTSLGAAKSADQMAAVSFNTMVKGCLSVLFVVCTLIVIGYALVRTFQALKTGGGVSTA